MQGKRKKVAVNMFSQGMSLSTSIYGGFHTCGVLGGGSLLHHRIVLEKLLPHMKTLWVRRHTHGILLANFSMTF